MRFRFEAMRCTAGFGRGRLLALVLGMCAALGLALVGGCSRAPEPAADPELVAKVGEREIRTPELLAWMKRRAAGADAAGKEAALGELLVHAALVEKAKAAGLDRDPELKRSWESMLIGRLRELELEPRLSNAVPSDAEIQANYLTNLPSFGEPEARRAAMLFIEVSPKASEDRKTAARQRMEAARTKADSMPSTNVLAPGFGALAVEVSEDQATRYRGGDLGWMQPGRGDARLDPKAWEALWAMKTAGELSGVIDGAKGLYLLRLTDIRPARTKPLDSVRPAIRHRMLMANRDRLETEWKDVARAAARIQVYTNALNSLELPAESGGEGAAAPPAVPR